MRLEYLAWCDKLAVEELRAVNNPRRWKTIWNDARIDRLATQLHNGEISPGRYLHKASWCILAAVHNGLRMNRNETNSSDDDSE